MAVSRRTFLLGTIFAPLLKFLPKRKTKLTWIDFEYTLTHVQEMHFRVMQSDPDYRSFAEWNDGPGRVLVSRRST